MIQLQEVIAGDRGASREHNANLQAMFVYRQTALVGDFPQTGKIAGATRGALARFLQAGGRGLLIVSGCVTVTGMKNFQNKKRVTV